MEQDRKKASGRARNYVQYRLIVARRKEMQRLLAEAAGRGSSVARNYVAAYHIVLCDLRVARTESYFIVLEYFNSSSICDCHCVQRPFNAPECCVHH